MPNCVSYEFEDSFYFLLFYVYLRSDDIQFCVLNYCTVLFKTQYKGLKQCSNSINICI